MSYRFRLDESFAKGFRRIAAEQINAAAERLQQSPDDPTHVHECRKNIKRTRALLRLMRPALGESVFQQENARLRDVARLLSARRDLQVVGETLTKLQGRLPSTLAGAAGKLEAALSAKRDGLDKTAQAEAVHSAREGLLRSLEALGRAKLDGRGFDIVGLGLKRCYAKSRSTFEAAYTQTSDAAFHEWRKTIQQHWRHMLLLSRAWPEALLPRARAARQLSDLLGEDHDLAVLCAYLATDDEIPLSARERRRIESHCRSRQAEIRAACEPLGQRLLAERPRALCRRVECYWRAAARIAARPVELLSAAPETPAHGNGKQDATS